MQSKPISEPVVTLLPSSYNQFLNEKPEKKLIFQNRKIVESTPPPPETKEEFIQLVYMRETDVNRLIKSGHIYFDQGKLHYKSL